MLLVKFLFIIEYYDSSKFSLTWITKLAHDDTGKLYKGDFDLYNFFVRNRFELENSFVFFLGDHGPRFGKETKTSFGRNEANNPFLYIVAPKSLRGSSIFKMLKKKENELVTPHDIHATLKDILEEQPQTNFMDTSYRSFLPASRGSSLLREFQAGVQRNCKTLPIPSQYCICQYAKIPLECSGLILSGPGAVRFLTDEIACRISEGRTDDALAIKLGQFAVDGINAILKQNSMSENCSHLILHQVHSVSVFVLPEAQMRTTSIYDVTFQTSPSAGIFQIPIRSKNGVLSLAGSTFTRLNEYGKQSYCIAKDTLKPICYCKRQQRFEAES
ncbi:hypothetical protein DICVIV_04320 [Dictyocaulus viviparus]|uniref:Uncharacterized protein n=1 Tax=Dictyocaulus viviparus TaxID=29172 RepID=A0A0D8Y070_DICVI|nr:hypothetical protein DICVIV_04320 [Dictyocaulus viviparus]